MEQIISPTEIVQRLVNKDEAGFIGFVKNTLKKQFSKENIKSQLDPFKYIKIATKTFLYDNENKRLFPASPLYEIAEIDKLEPGSQERRQKEIELAGSLAFMMSSAPQEVVSNPATRAYATYLKGLKKYKIPKSATKEQIGKSFEKAISKAEGNIDEVRTVLKDFRILDRVKPEEAIKDTEGVIAWFNELIKPVEKLPTKTTPEVKLTNEVKNIVKEGGEISPEQAKGMIKVEPVVKEVNIGDSFVSTMGRKVTVEGFRNDEAIVDNGEYTIRVSSLKGPNWEKITTEPTITKELEPLAKEAKKYETAEKFIEDTNPEVLFFSTENNKTITLDWISTHKKGKGIGTKAMSDLFVYADTKGKTIKLYPEAPTTKEPLTPEESERLIKWYESLGFKKSTKSTPEGRFWWVREPTTKAETTKMLTPTKAEIEKEEEKILAEVRGEIKQAEKDDPYGEVISKFKSFLRLAGEKKSKETGELFREHIPHSIFGMSSDEIAEAKGMTENEFMEDITKDIEIFEAERISPAKIKSLSKKAKTLYEKLDPKYYRLIKDVLGQVEGVSAKPTAKVKAKIKEREIKAQLKTEDQAFKEWQKSYRKGTITTRQQLNKSLMQAKKLTDQGIKERISKETSRVFAPSFRTPEYVLDKLNLKEKVYTPLKKGQEKVAKELNEYTKMSNDWWQRVGTTKKQRQEASKRIFQYLDGEDIELGAKEQSVAIEMKNYLFNWANRLGLPADKRIANYITHIFEPDFESGRAVFPDELARILDYVTPNKEFNPFLEKRTGAKGYKQDVFEALDAYVYRGTRKVYLDKALGKAAEMVDYLPTQAAKYVDEFLKNFKNRPSDFEKFLDQNFVKALSPKLQNLLGNRPAKRLTNLITTQVYRGTLGLNMGSALKNLTQGVNTFAELGNKYTTIGYMKLMTNGINELKKEGALDDLIIAEYKTTKLRSGLRKMDTGLFYFFETAEKINRGSAYFGAKQKFIDRARRAKPGDVILGEKLTEKDLLSEELIEAMAIEYAKLIVRKTQFAYGKLDTPLALQTPAGKLGFTLATYPLKQFEFIGGMVKRKEWRKLARYIASSLVITALVGDYLGLDYKDIFVKNVMPTLGIIPSTIQKLTSSDDWEREKTIKNTAKILTIPGYGGLKKLVTAMSGESTTATGRVRFKIDTPKEVIQTILSGEWSTDDAEQYLIDIGIKDGRSWVDDLLYIITGKKEYAPSKKSFNILDSFKVKKAYASELLSPLASVSSEIQQKIENRYKKQLAMLENETPEEQLDRQIKIAKDMKKKYPEFYKSMVGEYGEIRMFGQSIHKWTDDPIENFIDKYFGEESENARKVLLGENAKRKTSKDDDNINRIDPKTGKYDKNAPVKKFVNKITGKEEDSTDRGLFRINNERFFDILADKRKGYRNAMYKAGIIDKPDFKHITEKKAKEYWDRMLDPELNTKMAKIVYDLNGWCGWYAAPEELAKNCNWYKNLHK